MGEKKTRNIRIAVVRAGMSGQTGSDAMKPLIFPILASLCPAGADLVFLDDRVEELPEEPDWDIAAISVETFAAQRAYQLAERWRRPGLTVVMGGYHPTAVPEECLEHCDVVLVGDAEDTWPRFLEDYGKGEHRRRYDSAGRCPLAAVDSRHPAFAGKRYAGIGVAQFSRGCKFRCDFCSVKSMYGGPVRQKSAGDVVWELQNAKEKIFFFLDDNLFLDEQSALELFETIRPLRKKWACQISMDVAFNDKLLRAMRGSGCVLVLIGFESLQRDNLQQMNKHVNLQAGDYGRAVANLYRHGLLIYATFVLGYDHDTPQSIARTERFAQQHRFTVANFNPLIPMPDTPLYRRLGREGRLLYDRWWLDARYRYGDTAFQPRGMTPEELKEGCRRARYRFYRIRSILGRLIRNPRHWTPAGMLLFWTVNIISRREIRRKQGRLLGGETDETDTH